MILTLLAVAGGWHYLTDRAKSELAAAIRRADIAAAAGDYATAKKTLEDAVTAVPDRSDRADLIAPAQSRLRDIADKIAAQEAARARAEALRRPREAQADADRKERDRQAGEVAAKAKHEQEALIAVGEIKAKTAAGQYQEAIDAANAALRQYFDTSSGREFPNLLAAATGKLKGELAGTAAKEQAERDRQAADDKAKHDRFVMQKQSTAPDSESDTSVARAIRSKVVSSIQASGKLVKVSDKTITLSRERDFLDIGVVKGTRIYACSPESMGEARVR